MSDDGATLTLRALWDETAAVIGARHEARWMCEVATSLDDSEFDAELDSPVTERMVAHLDAMVARYQGGEPLQYVLGRWSFRHLDLAIDRRVLIPRPETELVAGCAIELAGALPAPRRVADLGTGSGAIGLALATELPLDGTEVWITDVDDGALAVATANLAGIGRPARNVMVGQGSWFEGLPGDARFDLIVSNPPYVAVGSSELDESVSTWEPAIALMAGHGGLDAHRVLVPGARDHLVDGGWLVLEIGADQGDALRGLLAAHGYGDIEIRPDLTGNDRIAIARA
jgi:release factor glutamine methyltransferase